MTKDELHLYHEQAFDSFSRHVTKYRPHHPLPLRQAQVYKGVDDYFLSRVSAM